MGGMAKNGFHRGPVDRNSAEYRQLGQQQDGQRECDQRGQHVDAPTDTGAELWRLFGGAEAEVVGESLRVCARVFELRNQVHHRTVDARPHLSNDQDEPAARVEDRGVDDPVEVDHDVRKLAEWIFQQIEADEAGGRQPGGLDQVASAVGAGRPLGGKRQELEHPAVEDPVVQTDRASPEHGDRLERRRVLRSRVASPWKKM